MRFLFTFQGRIKQLPYMLWSLGLFASQYLVVLANMKAHPGGALRLDWQFVFLPLRTEIQHGMLPAAIGITALAYYLLLPWLLAVLTFRRANDAGLPAWLALLAMVPIIQVPAILSLWFAPSRDIASDPAIEQDEGKQWNMAVLGLLAGAVFAAAAVSLSTLVFGAYGTGVFVLTPTIIGAITAAIANWNRDMGRSYTNQLVAIGLTLGGLAIVTVAIEGIVCLIMAAPLAYPMAYFGGLLGRALALENGRSARRTLSGFTMLPLVLLGDTLLPPAISFQTDNIVTIEAPPSRVWESLIAKDEISQPLPSALRLGMAYPIRSELNGEGIGATRLGVFSTGTALERITEWEPGRKLAFTVVRDVPSMTELSPYAHVHAPHAIGYFSTTGTGFELRPMENGGTGLILRTSHVLKLDPVFYWLPLARFVVDQNNGRVLAHIKYHAEQMK